MPSDLIRRERAVRVRKKHQTKNPEPRFDSIETEKALGSATTIASEGENPPRIVRLQRIGDIICSPPLLDSASNLPAPAAFCCRKKLQSAGCFDCDKVITVGVFSPVRHNRTVNAERHYPHRRPGAA